MSEAASPRGRPKRPVSTAASTTSSGSAGRASIPSASRISTASGQPPRHAANKPDGGAERRRGQRHGEADGQRDARAEEQAQQDVAAELVGAERVFGGGRGVAGEQVGREGVVAEPGLHPGRRRPRPAASGSEQRQPEPEPHQPPARHGASGRSAAAPTSAARVASMVTAEASSSASSARL